MQLYNVDYADEYDLLELGIKFNSKLTNDDQGDCLSYTLTDSNGNSYQMVNKITDSGGRYGFARICFEQVDIDLDSNDLRYTDENEQKQRIETSYKLSVRRKSDNELLFEFELYDNSVTFSRTDYED